MYEPCFQVFVISSFPAFAYGDPHFSTFDGLPYTFNSHGEFWLLQTNVETESDVFNLQARMEPPSDRYCKFFTQSHASW